MSKEDKLSLGPVFFGPGKGMIGRLLPCVDHPERLHRGEQRTDQLSKPRPETAIGGVMVRAAPEMGGAMCGEK